MEIGLSTYDTWRLKDRIPPKTLRRIAEEKEVNYGWLTTGEGPKFIDQGPLYLSPDMQKSISDKIKASECEGNENLQEICRAFSRVDEGRQKDALKAVIATIAKYY
jgi:hypothetical protein